MVYCETIETSKTWVCPKTGIWKVICVGGGGAGVSYYNDSANSIGTAGGTTSFGSILSASGGISGYDVNKNKFNEDSNVVRYTMGINGYNGAGAYGATSGEHIGSGYGASGGACYNSNAEVRHSGLPGDVKSVITDISEGTSIACTIGSGGTVTTKGTSVIAFPGKSGAIIVQYLGSEM